MKLEAVNTRMNPGIEVFPPKDVSPDIGTLDSVDFDSLSLSHLSCYLYCTYCFNVSRMVHLNLWVHVPNLNIFIILVCLLDGPT